MRSRSSAFVSTTVRPSCSMERNGSMIARGTSWRISGAALGVAVDEDVGHESGREAIAITASAGSATPPASGSASRSMWAARRLRTSACASG